MEDITPGLIAAVTEDFRAGYDTSPKIQTLLAKIKSGGATYAEAQEYALEVSRLISAAYDRNVSSAVLPDGRMYYNIASRLIPETLDENHKLVSDYAARVQKLLNDQAKVGLRVQSAPLDADRVEGLVNLASSAERYDDVSQQLLTAYENFSQNIVDETIRRNADFHASSGLSPKIIRRAESKCCVWCRSLAGVHNYPVDREVYRRHENCRCTVLYDPADGSKKLQNAHTKQWKSSEEHDILNLRKSISPKEARKSTSRLFRTQGDPMKEVTGPAEKSNPNEIADFRKELLECGVEIIQRDRESLGYAPGFLPGNPGTIYVSKGASYSAWCHEMQHMRDDRDAGWSGMRILTDLDERYIREERAYSIEIAMARDAGREDIADRLKANLEVERRIIYGD